jgi:hypothetical protein
MWQWMRLGVIPFTLMVINRGHEEEVVCVEGYLPHSTRIYQYAGLSSYVIGCKRGLGLGPHPLFSLTTP